MAPMVSKRFSVRKCSNAENLSPHHAKANAKADCLAAVSRRRRTRVVSGSLKLNKELQNKVLRRVSKVKHVQIAVKLPHPSPAPAPAPALAPEAPAPAPTPEQQIPLQAQPGYHTLRAPRSKRERPAPYMTLPRFLRRPAGFPKPIPEANIAAVSPTVAQIPVKYIQDGLEATGQRMWNSLEHVEYDTPSVSPLPTEVEVAIHDLSASMPTHVLAAWSLEGPAAVRFLPTHSLVLAAHCAKLRPLPPSPATATAPTEPGARVTLPVVPFPVPHLPTMSTLVEHLYTKRTTDTIAALLPAPAASLTCKPSSEVPWVTAQARGIAATYTVPAIQDRIQRVVGLWKNAVYLGVSDRRLWVAMDVAWDVLVSALAISVGAPDAVPRPQARAVAA